MQSEFSSDHLHAAVREYVEDRIRRAVGLYSVMELFENLSPEQAHDFLGQIDADRPTDTPHVQPMPFVGGLDMHYLERVEMYEVMRWAVSRRADGLPAFPSRDEVTT